MAVGIKLAIAMITEIKQKKENFIIRWTGMLQHCVKSCITRTQQLWNKLELPVLCSRGLDDTEQLMVASVDQSNQMRHLNTCCKKQRDDTARIILARSYNEQLLKLEMRSGMGIDKSEVADIHLTSAPVAWSVDDRTVGLQLAALFLVFHEVWNYSTEKRKLKFFR